MENENESDRDYSTIYIIRHGEKKHRLHMIDCLNQEGIQRSYNLINVFNDKILPKPEYIFANHFFDQLDCQRCIQLVVPLADKLNIKINHDYGTVFWMGNDKKLVGKIRDIISKKHTNILIAWEHVNITTLSKLFGISPPHWPDHDYDRIYEIKIFDNNMVSFNTLHQKFKFQESVVMKPYPEQILYDRKWIIHIHAVSVCIILVMFFIFHNPFKN